MTPVGVDLSLTGTGISTEERCRTVGTLARMSMGYRLTFIIEAIEEEIAVIDEPYIFVEDLLFFVKKGGPMGMVHGALHYWAFQVGVPIFPIAGSALKKFATGKGNATKPDMRMSLYRRADIDLRDDNQVDAWWLRALGYHIMGQPIVELPKEHLAGLDKLKIQFLEAASA